MVNWDARNIVHTSAHAGSKEFKSLVEQGYVKVGVIKPEVIEHKGYNPHISEVKFFWDSDYFEPKAKYIRKPKPYKKIIDEILSEDNGYPYKYPFNLLPIT